MNRWIRRGLGTIATFGLVFGLAFLAGRGGAGGDRWLTPQDVVVTGYSIAAFQRGKPELRRFGQLEFIGGVELRGQHANFGGISGLRIRPDGERFMAVTDAGDWISGRILYRAGAPAGLADVVIAPVLLKSGQRAKDAGLWDAESLTLDGDEAFIGIERDHAVLRFDMRTDGVRARGERIPLPGFARRWPENRGIEAIGIMPAGGPLAGKLIGLAERSGSRDEPTEGFVMRRDGGEAFRFLLTRSDGFDVTDLDFLPGGDLAILERTFSPLRGVAMRLRRVRIADIRPEGLVDGETLLTADRDFNIDNMEGLSIHRNKAGETILSIISDDNFSVAQRTLLLQFRWLGN